LYSIGFNRAGKSMTKLKSPAAIGVGIFSLSKTGSAIVANKPQTQPARLRRTGSKTLQHFNH
jgi:hypothetical protein